MWILPRQLHISPFVQDTEELISDCNEQSEASAQSCLVRSKHSPARTWSAKWKRDTWTQHLSGRILKPSLGIAFAERWTSSLEASLANHSAPQESVKETKIPDTFSRSFWTELEDADLPLFSLRMLKESCPQNLLETTGETLPEPRFCSMSLGNWNGWVTKQRQAYSARAKGSSAHLTNASGSLSWPTARTNDSNSGRPNDGESRIGANGQRFGINLSDKVEFLEKNWPAVTATEARQGFQDRSRGMKGSQESLTTVVVKSGLAAQENPSTNGSRQELFPTPSATDHITQPTSKSWKEKGAVNFKLSNPEVQQTWVTPRTSGSSTRPNKTSPRQGLCLIEQVREQAWATPQSRDAKGAEGRMIREGNYTDLPSQTEVEQTGSWNRNNGKLNPRWVETLMGLPVGWTMPSCKNPIAPIAEPVQSMGGGNWMTPEALNSTGYQISNGQKILRLGSQVIQHSTLPVTIAPTNSDFSETELSLQPQNSPSELSGRN